MNGTNGTLAPNNSKVIHIVVTTVCLAALIGVTTEAYCYVAKVPDMNQNLSGAFMHVTDTLIGALIAMLINTRPQEQRPAEKDTSTEPTSVTVEQPLNQPIPVTETITQPKP